MASSNRKRDACLRSLISIALPWAELLLPLRDGGCMNPALFRAAGCRDDFSRRIGNNCATSRRRLGVHHLAEKIRALPLFKSLEWSGPGS